MSCCHQCPAWCWQLPVHAVLGPSDCLQDLPCLLLLILQLVLGTVLASVAALLLLLVAAVAAVVMVQLLPLVAEVVAVVPALLLLPLPWLLLLLP